MKTMKWTIGLILLVSALLLCGCQETEPTTPPVTDITTETAWEDPVPTQPGSYIVANMAELLALEPAEMQALVIMQGYYTPGDGGGGTFLYNATTRTTEDGGVVIKSSVARGRFTRQCDPLSLNVKWFGAVGDGKHDDTDAIQQTILALPEKGGTVIVPGGTYSLSKTIQIGNGNAGETISGRSGVRLIGTGGMAVTDGTAPTVFRADQKMESVLYLVGRISDCELSGICFDANGKAENALYLHSFSGCHFSNLTLTGFTKIGLKIMGGNEPTGNYNIFNRFETIHVKATADHTTCLFLDGIRNDTWLTTLTDCSFDAGSYQNAKAAHFRFVDSISFYRCRFKAKDTSSVGMVFDAFSVNLFPCGMAFYDCSVDSTKVLEDNTHQIRKQYFFGLKTTDGEPIPTNNKLIGVTDQGETFNLDDVESFIAAKDPNYNWNEYTLLPKAGRVETFQGLGAQEHYNLKDPSRSVAVLVNAATKVTGFTLYCSSYSNAVGSIKVEAYEWNTDYATTVAGQPVASGRIENFPDNSWQEVAFEGLSTGYYLIVITGDVPASDYGVAVWKSTKVSSSITFIDGKRAEVGLYGALLTE
ncbi:MAG: hypothetical protein E7618_05450 [Ruminococcaceae bacterium]|nr:hypothetical protein [Oscillospiraceae bacterium]